MDSNHRLIISKLIDKTKSGKSIWRKSNQYKKDDVFVLDLQSGAVSVQEFRDGFTEEDIVMFSIFNDKGEAIVSYSTRSGLNQEDYRLLFDLHETVEDKYYKKNETVAGIIAELDSDKIIGEEQNSD